MEPFWGPFWGPFFGTLISQPGSIHCIRVRLCLTFGTPHFLIRVPKNGPKNGLRMDPKMDHFGTLNQATKMDPFFDVSKSANVRKWGVPKVKQSRTRMQCSDPGWEMRVPKNGPQNGPQFRYTKPMKNTSIFNKKIPKWTPFWIPKSIDFGTSKRYLK